MELTSFIIFFLILSLTYALVIVERVKTPRKDSYTLEFIFICSAVIFILYKIFFFYAPYFTNLNDSYPLESYTPPIKGWVAQHDGVEGFVLYAFMLASLTLCWIASWTLSTFKKKWHVIIVVVACLFTTDFLVLQIGWHPPVPGISENGKSTLYLLLGSIIFTVFFCGLIDLAFIFYLL